MNPISSSNIIQNQNISSIGHSGVKKANFSYDSRVQPIGTPTRDFGLGMLSYILASPDTMNSDPKIQELINDPNKSNSSLVLVDCQNDFIPDPTKTRQPGLPVNGADSKVAEVVKMVKKMEKGIPDFDQIIITCDNHPADHSSFHSTYINKNPDKSDTAAFSNVPTNYGYNQTLWPDHCVQGTEGAFIHEDIAKALNELQQKLGANCPRIILCPKGEGQVESYSAGISESGDKLPFVDILEKTCKKGANVCHVGFATDYCVMGTARSTDKVPDMELKSIIYSEASAGVMYDDKQFTNATGENRIAGAKPGEISEGRAKQLTKDSNVTIKKTYETAIRRFSVRERVAKYEALGQRVFK